jgi:hypothetical protein
MIPGDYRIQVTLDIERPLMFSGELQRLTA